MAENPTVKLGVLISGSGTNLQAIIDAILRGDLKAEIRLVISNRADAQGLERARRHGIETMVIDHRKFASREDFDRAILAALLDRSVELVALAGFMRLLSPVMLEAFPGRIMNIHNSLLPSFPGIHGPKDAIEYGVKIAGCTVFFVTSGVDAGPVIVQAAVPVLPGDNEQRLAARILLQEHRIFSHAIALFQQGRLEIQGRRVVITGNSPTPNSSPLVNPPVD
ncbi:phosphoribosylglycinamide formyltransferase [Candidatus Binatus sp.]|uniref:phosphoribosylglycinamide formyltransferase n=1 Tax=Candidatus Binatus sp. TaxID=2811406 RepID=UPI002FDB7CDE